MTIKKPSANAMLQLPKGITELLAQVSAQQGVDKAVVLRSGLVAGALRDALAVVAAGKASRSDVAEKRGIAAGEVLAFATERRR